MTFLALIMQAVLPKGKKSRRKNAGKHIPRGATLGTIVLYPGGD